MSTIVDRIQGLSGSLALKPPVRVATTANITLNGLQAIDGVALVSGDRVLVRAQTDTSENGIYDANTSDWSRSLDFNGANDLTKGTLVLVTDGTNYGMTTWHVSTTGPVIGSALAFTRVFIGASDSVSHLPAGSGAVETDVRTKLRERVSVKDFGAVGDGVTDDTDAIQAAIDSGIRSIYFPAGDYLASSTIAVTANYTSLVGDAHGSSRLVASADGVSVLYFASATPTATTLKNCSLRNISVVVGSAVASITSGIGIKMTNCQQFQMSNVQIEGFYGGLLIEGGGINFLTNLVVNSGYNFGAYRSGSYGVKAIAHDLGSGSYKNPAGIGITSFDIFNGTSNGYLDHAIYIESCDGLWFSNGHCGFTHSACAYINPSVPGSGNVWVLGLAFNQVHFDCSGGLTEYGVKYNWPTSFSGSIRRHSFTGCHVGNAKYSCYYINGSSIEDISINGGRINLVNNSEWGIYIKDASRISIIGTVIDAVGATGITGGGALLDGADFVKIDAIFDTLPTGLSITNNATRNNIEGIFNSCTNDVDTSGLSNTTNRLSGSTTNVSYTVASASNIILQYPHEIFSITGNTTIDAIDATDVFLFRKVTLLFTSNCIVTDGTIKLAGAYTSTAGSSLTLIYNGSEWVEVSRAIL